MFTPSPASTGTGTPLMSYAAPQQPLLYQQFVPHQQVPSPSAQQQIQQYQHQQYPQQQQQQQQQQQPQHVLPQNAIVQYPQQPSAATASTTTTTTTTSVAPLVNGQITGGLPQTQAQVQNITDQMRNVISNNPQEKNQMTLELYRRILNFNFVGKYDPKLKQIIHQTPHAVVYKFNSDTDEWEKLDYQGALIFYERNIDQDPVHTYLSNDELKLKDNYNHGLMIINRNNPKNISLGIISKRITSKYADFYHGMNYEIQNANDLLMVRNTLGDVYGLWIHNEKDRDVFFQFIQYAVGN